MGLFEHHGAPWSSMGPQVKSQWSPLGLDGAPGEEPMEPHEQVGPLKQESMGTFDDYGALKLAGAPRTSGAPKTRVNRVL